jgi:type I restriction enzyme S subunit
VTLEKVEDLKTTKPLPNGWQWTKLGKVCEIIAGQSPPSETYHKEPVGLPFFQGKADFGKRYPTARVWCSNPIKISQPGDILISVRAPVGPTNVANMECCIGRGLAAIRCSEKVNKDYILWTLKLFELQLSRLGSGSTFTSIDTPELKNFEVPLPPTIAEQESIACTLNEKMAEIEKTRISVEARLKAATALPAAYLRQEFESRKSEKWQKSALGDILRVKSGNFLPSNKMNASGQYPVYGGNGINGYHDTFMFSEPKIIIGRVGAQCGCVCISEPNAWITDNALYVSEKLKPFDDEFMELFLTKIDLHNKANSMAQPLISGKIIYEIEAAIPNVDEQKQIAVNLHKKYSEIEILIAAIRAELETLNILPIALLRWAFSGDL